MILETKRLLLREMKPDDFQALFLVLGDHETMWHYPYTFDGQHVKDWIERNMNRYRKDGFGLWAVCLKQSGEMIGDCGLTLQNINGKTLPEIGYHIRHDCQRKGYASEAAKAVRNWAFRNTDYPTLYSCCKYTNVISKYSAEIPQRNPASCTRTRCGAERRNEARLFSMTACVRVRTARSTGDIAA